MATNSLVCVAATPWKPAAITVVNAKVVVAETAAVSARSTVEGVPVNCVVVFIIMSLWFCFNGIALLRWDEHYRGMISLARGKRRTAESVRETTKSGVEQI